MFIKQITICGFKSYKDVVKMDDVDPGFNIIVGRNGSGKSNLFAAIEFALTLEYRNLRAEDRHALLYNGKKTYDQAYVEIVLDNTDKKLPIPSDTVTFRRLIAGKKDQFFCNGKELQNAKQFLELAGVTNPYFIVKQGKVNQLAVGTDQFRLKLLENIAGSTFFDEKLLHAQKTLKDAGVKKSEMEEILKNLYERKQTLEGEATELKKFLAYDSQRRAIEHILNEREQTAAKLGISKCQLEREFLTREQEPIQQELKAVQKHQQKLSLELDSIISRIQSVNARKEAVFAEIPILVAEQTRLKNLRADCRKQFEEGSSTRHVKKRVNDLEKEMSEEEQHLEKAQKDLETAEVAEEKIIKSLIEKETELKALESRLEGAVEFMNDNERKNWISNIKKEIEKTNQVCEKAKTKLEDLTTEKQACLEKQEQVHSELISIRTELSKLHKKSTHPDMELFNGQKSRDEMWKELNEIDQKLVHEKGVRFNVMEQLRKRIGKDTINGWEGILTVVEELRRNGELDVVQGYYGLVIENFSYKEDVDMAIEAAAGNKLFYHVVQNHNVSRRLLQEFNRKELRGAPVFIPIEEIHVPVVTYPPENTEEYYPLIETINFPPALRKIFQYVFGSTLLCRELSNATYAAKTYKFNCVTTDGDKVSKLGPITGGYVAAQMGKLELQRGKVASDSKIKEFTTQKVTREQQLKKLDEMLVQAAHEKELRMSKYCGLSTEKDRKECEVRFVQDQLNSLEAAISSAQKDVEKWKHEAYELSCRRSTFEIELNRKKRVNSQGDRSNVLELRKIVKKLREEKSLKFATKLEKRTAVNFVAQKISQLRTELDQERCQGLELHSSQEQKERLEDLSNMIDRLKEQIKQKQQEATTVAEDLPQLNEQVLAKKFELEAAQEKEREVRNKLNSLEKQLHQQLAILNRQNTKLSETIEAMKLLGTLPSDSSSYQNTQSKKLYGQLNKLVKYLSETSQVNQKAAEQWNEITEKYEYFDQKIKNLNQVGQNLEGFIQSIKLKKGDSILKIFRQLQKEFQNIFLQVVPQGNAELVLYGKDFQVDSSSSSSTSSADTDYLRERAGSEVEGVKIRVNFINKSTRDMQYLLQLSGGQKSVVALCLILAIQKVDPVPFYLFDEVDQALDSEYRTAVAKVIHDLATQFNLQFICTTFRREFLAEAHKCFGVSHMRSRSSVRPVTIDEALNFVETDIVPESSSDPPESQGDSSDSHSPGSSSGGSSGSGGLMPPPPTPPRSKSQPRGGNVQGGAPASNRPSTPAQRTTRKRPSTPAQFTHRGNTHEESDEDDESTNSLKDDEDMDSDIEAGNDTTQSTDSGKESSQGKLRHVSQTFRV